MSVIECIAQCRAVLNTILKETPANDATKQTVLKNKINLCTETIEQAQNCEWVGLTDEERYLNEARSEEEIEYARAIEAKLKEKNT
jgi:hypothetical protein